MAQGENGRLAVTLRLPRELIDRIDRIRESQAITVPRNTWIAEAVARRAEVDAAEGEEDNAAK